MLASSVLIPGQSSLLLYQNSRHSLPRSQFVEPTSCLTTGLVASHKMALEPGTRLDNPNGVFVPNIAFYPARER